MILVPARGGVEEVEIESDGKDGDLEKIEKANGVDAGGVLLRKRKEDHENRSGPDEEENVGWPRILSRAGNKTLVVGADDLSESFEGKGDGEEEPELAGVAGGAAGGVEGSRLRREGPWPSRGHWRREGWSRRNERIRGQRRGAAQ